MLVPSLQHLDRLLSRGLARQTHASFVRPLPPWSVARIGVAAGQPETVIAKWSRARTHGPRSAPNLLRTEAASLEYLAEIGFERAPRLIAADADLLVLEDLAPRRPLDELLIERGPEECKAQLLDYARTLGELGARSAGLQATFDNICSRRGLAAPPVPDTGPGTEWLAFCQTLGPHHIAPSAPAAAELVRIAAELSAPGPFLAFSNGDVQVNNFLVGEHGDGRLIDFEGGGFRHALSAGVLFHTPGTAWITVAGPLAHDLESAFRTTLAQRIPEAGDDALFGRGLVAATLAWACTRLTRLVQLDARPARDDGRVQMLATLQAAAAVARRHRQWLYAAEWMECTAGRLRRRWPDADIDLAALKPYTPRR